MLQSLRAASQSKVAKSVFIILLASFALWGIGPIFTGGRIHTAATAGKVKITTTQADEAFQQQLKQLERQYGLSLPPEVIAQLGIKQQALQRLVMQALYDQEAAKLGLRLGRELVEQTISVQPVFRDATGKFDPQRFRALLQQMGLSEAAYVSMLQEDIIRTLLMGSVRGAGHVPEVLARSVYNWENELRDIEMLQVKAADQKGLPAPTDEELTKFHTDHSDRYMAPEYRSISYIFVDSAKAAANVAVSDEEAKAAYDAAPQDYAVPEKRDITQITTQDKDLAEKIAAEAMLKPLADVAKENNVMAGSLADITKAGILQDLAGPIFALELGKPSTAIKSQMGWHVVVVDKITPPIERSFEQVKKEIVDNLRSKKSSDAVYELSKKIQDGTASGAKLEELGPALNLTVSKVEAVDAAGETPAGTKASEDENMPDILKTAFDTRQGEISPLGENSKGVYVVQVDSVTPAQLKALDSVRKEVTAAVVAAKQLDEAERKANELGNQLRNGGSVSGLAPLNGLKRDGSNRSKLPESAMRHIFTSAVGDVLTAKDDNSVWIVRVKAITPADPKADISKVRDELREPLAVDLLEQFGTSLRTSYGVKINDSWVKQSESVQ